MEIKSTTKTKAVKSFSQSIRRLVGKCFKKNCIVHCILKRNLLVPLTKTLWDLSNIKELALREGGLKVALFFTQDPREEWDHTAEAHRFFSSLPAVDFFCKSHTEIVQLLRHSKFIGFASVLVIVHRNSLLESVVKAMHQNEYLRYKSKVIMCRYHLKISTSLITSESKLGARQMAEMISSIQAIFTNLGEFIKSDAPNAFRLHDQDLSIDVSEAQRDLNYFKSLSVDYFILAQWFTHDDMCDYYFYAFVLYSVLINIIRPLKPALQEKFSSARFAVTSTSAADQYLYSINPALAIIINNNYFTDANDVRKGSEQDVIRLIRELKIARIPYILIEDSSQEELLKVLHYVATKDFRPLKSLLLFLMSHGGEGDIIYTYDGEVNIKENIVKPIQYNKSLKKAKLQVAINACRGDTDIEWGDRRDFARIQPTDDSHLAKNTVVLYSVPDTVQSLRSEETGSPFVQTFCKHFRHFKHTDDIRVLNAKIKTDPEVMDFFPDPEKSSELIMGDVDELHNIIQTPENFFQMIQLLKSIAKDFPLRESFAMGGGAGDDCTSGVGASSFVCGSLNSDKVPKHDFVEKYIAPELDADSFSIFTDD